MSDKNKDGTSTRWLKHITREGSRRHVIWWDNRGRHCSEKNCEVNKNE